MDDAKLSAVMSEHVDIWEDQKHTLFCDVKALCSVRIVISTSKKFPENRIIPAKIGGVMHGMDAMIKLTVS